MSEIKRIQDQLKRAIVKKTWASSSLLEILDGVTAKQALKRPIKKGHNIWEIVLHIITWQDVVKTRVNGKVWFPTAEEDWPKVNKKTEADWQETIVKLKKSYQAFYRAIGKFSDKQLSEIPLNGKTARYVQIHGLIQHHLYHAGQIALLKKSL